MGSGITRSGAMLLKKVSDGTSGVSGRVTMITVDESSGSSDSTILPERSAVSGTGGSIKVSVGYVDNDVGGTVTVSAGISTGGNRGDMSLASGGTP